MVGCVLQAMSFVLPSSINLVEYSGRPWSDIQFIEKDGEASAKSSSSPKENKSTRLLPRTDHPLFGLFPKLDTRVLFECSKCGKVVLPSAFLAHCANPEHEAMVPIAQQLPPAPAGKMSSRSRKAAIKPAAVTVASSSNTILVVPVPPPPAAPQPPVAAPTAASNGRASKHKKSAKSNKRSRTKEEKSEPAVAATPPPYHVDAAPLPPAALDDDADAHPAKVTKHDVEHLVAVPYGIVEAPPPFASVAPVESLPPEMLVDVGPTEEVETIDTSYASVDDAQAAFINMESAAALQEHDAHQLHTISLGEQIDVQVQMKVVEEMVEMEPEEVRQMIRAVEEQVQQEEEMMVVQEAAGVVEETVVSSGSAAAEEEGQEPEAVDHMPMSPVAVVNIVPVQNYQYLQQYLHLPTQPIVVTIPCSSTSSHHTFGAYPKPLTVSTRAMRKIGGTYLLQSQRLERQRAEIQALTRSRHALNHLPT